MIKLTLFLGVFLMLCSCSNSNDKELVDEDKLGIINADVTSEETNLKEKVVYNDAVPGSAEMIDRAFENAPPMIPHTTEGFLPIKTKNNICLTCHMPELAKAMGAIPLSATHFMNLRPKMVEVEGVLKFENEDQVHVEQLDKLNQSYFSCTQCHAPQADVSIGIENLFTPEFREEFGLEKSNLKSKIREGTE